MRPTGPTHFEDTTAHAAMAAALTEAWRAEAPLLPLAWLLQRAEWLARDNALSFQGGPFGALVVALESRTVLAAAANHATLWHDATAHAEVLALQKAAESGADLAHCLLLTSCECCPMCLAATFQSGIRHIVYHATRTDAARAGFADAAQYELMAQPMQAQATHLAPGDARHAQARAQLGDHEAVVLIPGGGGLEPYGKAASGIVNDPTATPCIRALRTACSLWGNPRLPPGSRLISRHAPHPMSLLAADWANLGRSGDLDDPAKDAGAILYFDAAPEPVPGLSAEAMWQALRDPAVAGMQRTHLPLAATEAFQAWVANLDKLQRY